MIPFDWRVLDRLGSIWRSYRNRGARIAPEEHSVTAVFPLLAAGSTSSVQTITFPDSSQFVWYASAAMILNAAGVVQFQNDAAGDSLLPQAPMVLIRDGQNGKTYARSKRFVATREEGFAPVASICGTGERPFVLPFPITLNPSDFLELQFFNGFGPVAFSMHLTFLGWKLTP